ncbi:uncharacterized protein MELLADRAFT_114401 [Melampsora larici-populina 98AG31]|uniref:Uncharacterized protein n=1 Tax=Melampsora larici-populina (strain 98AG31 / pathotype 3-4-7) TaxID=747676 RepID=F4SDB3_MELLP|nr:uncharacterized protein MELLADRAFT_114401 [Melampsora larici-populina 98AG31]EGF97360.1 hypothetical protein MELLADRAFT_114401 [Melampsora larici-populina 98AG31]
MRSMIDHMPEAGLTLGEQILFPGQALPTSESHRLSQNKVARINPATSSRELRVKWAVVSSLMMIHINRYLIEPLPPQRAEDPHRGHPPPVCSFQWKSHLQCIITDALPTRVGKTCSIYALANEIGWDVFELNSGVLRKRKEIDR